LNIQLGRPVEAVTCPAVALRSLPTGTARTRSPAYAGGRTTVFSLQIRRRVEARTSNRWRKCRQVLSSAYRYR
jgi:hypothetical protein